MSNIYYKKYLKYKEKYITLKNQIGGAPYILKYITILNNNNCITKSYAEMLIENIGDSKTIEEFKNNYEAMK